MDAPDACLLAAAALFFPACVYGRALQLVPAKESRLGGKPRQAAACYCLLSPLCVFPLNCVLRRHVHPDETEFRAAGMSLCCAPCSLVEVTQELDRRHAEKSRPPALLGPPREQRMGTCSSKYCEL